MTNKAAVAPRLVDHLENKSTGLYPWYVVSVLMLASACSFVDRMIMGLLVGPIRQTFDISDTQYSLLAGAAFALFYVSMGLPLARIADSKSRRMLITLGILVWSLMTALCGFAKGFWTLFFARMGVGVGEASLSPAAYSMISDYFPKKSLAKAFSVFTIGVTVGSGLAYIIGGKVISLVESIGVITLPLLGEIHGWQMTFLMVGLPGIVIALLMLTVKEPPRRGKSSKSHGVPIRTVLEFIVARRVAIGTHVFGVSILIMVVFGINIWGPTYLIRTFGYSPANAGLVFGSIFMVVGTLGLLSGGTLADKWFSKGRHDAYSRVIVISAVLMMPFVVALAFVENEILGIVCIAISAYFSAFQGGIAGGALQLMTPNEMRGQLAAVYFLFANLIGFGLGPTVVAAVTDYVFQNDAAIAKSLSLTAAILCPLSVAIILSGIRHVETAVKEASSQSHH